MLNKGLHIVFLSILITCFMIFEAYALGLTPKEIYQRISPGVVFIYASQGCRIRERRYWIDNQR